MVGRLRFRICAISQAVLPRIVQLRQTRSCSVSSGTSAETYFGLIVDGIKAGGEKGEDVAAIGERAFLVAGGSAEMPSFTVIVLKGETIATITAIGIAREAAIAATQAVAGRL